MNFLECASPFVSFSHLLLASWVVYLFKFKSAVSFPNIPECAGTHVIATLLFDDRLLSIRMHCFTVWLCIVELFGAFIAAWLSEHIVILSFLFPLLMHSLAHLLMAVILACIIELPSLSLPEILLFLVNYSQ